MQLDTETQAVASYLEQQAAAHLTNANRAHPALVCVFIERAAEYLRAANVAKGPAY